METDVLFVEDGKFTTCDLDHPHYYFGSPTMKITVKDKIVARPIFLYIADVPVFALPFGIFPSERGRRSGSDRAGLRGEQPGPLPHAHRVLLGDERLHGPGGEGRRVHEGELCSLR